MSEKVVKSIESIVDQLVKEADIQLISNDLKEVEEVTVDDLKGFDFESFVKQNSEELKKVLNHLQTDNSLPSIGVQQSSDPILGHLSDYLTSDDEEFGNSLIDGHINRETSSHCSQTYSSSSPSKSSPITLASTQQTVEQPSISASASSLVPEDTLVINQIDFNLDIFDISLGLESKPTIKVIDFVSKSYQKSRARLLRRARRLEYSQSRGSVNVWISYLSRIDAIPPKLTGIIKMGPNSERKTGTKGSTTGKYVHRLYPLSGLVTITVDNQKAVLKADQMIKVSRYSHYFITNSEPNESFIYFKISVN